MLGHSSDSLFCLGRSREGLSLWRASTNAETMRSLGKPLRRKCFPFAMLCLTKSSLLVQILRSRRNCPRGSLFLCGEGGLRSMLGNY